MMHPSSKPISDRRPSSPPDEASERATAYLHPGQLFVAADSYAVTTILGSCVAVCLWDPVTRIGGINHFLLPTFSGQGIASPRFGNIAIKDLLDQLAELG
ncbi:MAG TPA: chemotaxis protein CheD, partial [Candidatus Binatia bacterium]